MTGITAAERGAASFALLAPNGAKAVTVLCNPSGAWALGLAAATKWYSAVRYATAYWTAELPLQMFRIPGIEMSAASATIFLPSSIQYSNKPDAKGYPYSDFRYSGDEKGGGATKYLNYRHSYWIEIKSESSPVDTIRREAKASLTLPINLTVRGDDRWSASQNANKAKAKPRQSKKKHRKHQIYLSHTENVRSVFPVGFFYA
ncbi:hypothetical protein B7463_g10407, partial [Scytalidium lignicola]